MATIYPTSFNPVPSTPSTSSQSSLPPSYALPVHDHVLPPGWNCKFDPKNGKYYFLHDHLAQQWDAWKMGQHGSCQSSRSSSPSHTYTSYGRYFQPFSSRYKANDLTVQRIVKMFPEVDESYITHLLRIYHNKENSVISALLSEGHAKSYHAHPDEALFYKLKSYFPTVEAENIRQLLAKHSNAEHEVIGAIISSLGPNHARYQSTSVTGSPKMKLRYLKLIYPDADEAILFDLLYNCDHNAQDAIGRLEKMGYKRKDTIRPSSAKVESMSSIGSEATKAYRPQSAPVAPKHLQFPPNVADKQKIFHKLQESFPKADRTLINMALECSGFNEDRARLFLAAMTPQDSEKYLPKDLGLQGSPLLLRPCRGTQTKAFVETMAGTPIRARRAQGLKLINVATCTSEDGIIEDEKKKPLSKGPNSALRKGPKLFNLIKSYFPWRGSDSRHRQGPDASNKKGPESAQRTGSNNAKGPETKNRKGPNRMLLLLKK